MSKKTTEKDASRKSFGFKKEDKEGKLFASYEARKDKIMNSVMQDMVIGSFNQEEDERATDELR